jgi:hypothetical protein
VTINEYSPNRHDPQIMLGRVLWLLRLNRLQPIIPSLDEGSAADTARGGSPSRKISALLEPKIIWNETELMFFLLKAQNGFCCRSLVGRRTAAAGGRRDPIRREPDFVVSLVAPERCLLHSDVCLLCR